MLHQKAVPVKKPLLIPCLLLIALSTVIRAADPKTDAMKLLGTWSLKKSEDFPAVTSATVTYSEDGTSKGMLEFAGKSVEIKTSWKLIGDRITNTSKIQDKDRTETETIVKLTTEELITKNSKGKLTIWQRIKEEKSRK